MNFAEQMRAQVLTALQRGMLSHEQVNDLLRLLSKYRALLIQNTLLNLNGKRVQGGPFAGMEYSSGSAEGCHVPKLLGCYEQELHQIVEAAVATGYEDIVNIGCAEGYYAVGMARRCPEARIFAYDANPGAQQACRELAAHNGLAERVTIAGQFQPETFRTFQGRRALFLIDIEGNELPLLESVPVTELASFDFVIECHDCFGLHASERLCRFFEASHSGRLVKQQLGAVQLPALFDRLGHLDQLLAIWEWRSGPTPWLVAASNNWPGSPFFHAIAAAGV
jgi:hypothetical protein